jgi:hypothetical protein
MGSWVPGEHWTKMIHPAVDTTILRVVLKGGDSGMIVRKGFPTVEELQD